MNRNLTQRLLIYLAAVFFIISTLFTIGCAASKVKVEYEKENNSGYSEVNHKHKKGGPPPHAPAHGYRARHRYRYYHSCSVYYHCGRKLYFYLKGDNWEVGASLPSSIRVRLGEYVSMELDTDKPYVYHADHVKRYPPGQMKKKYKKKHKWG